MWAKTNTSYWHHLSGFQREQGTESPHPPASGVTDKAQLLIAWVSRVMWRSPLQFNPVLTHSNVLSCWILSCYVSHRAHTTYLVLSAPHISSCLHYINSSRLYAVSHRVYTTCANYIRVHNFSYYVSHYILNTNFIVFTLRILKNVFSPHSSSCLRYISYCLHYVSHRGQTTNCSTFIYISRHSHYISHHIHTLYLTGFFLHTSPTVRISPSYY